MKKLFNLPLILLAALVTFSSCEREKLDYGLDKDDVKSVKEGKLDLATMKASLKVEVENEQTKASTVNLDNYLVTIYDENKEQVDQWKYKDLPEIITLNVGEYEVKAESHEPEPVEWDTPFYAGNKDIVIQEATVTEVEEIICRLSNVKVSVRYTDELWQHISGTPKVEVSLGSTAATFEGDEQRAAYFQAEPEGNILIAFFTATIDGQEMTQRNVFKEVRAGDHQVIVFNIKTTNPDNNKEEGEFAPGITIDATCTVEDKDIIVKPGEDNIPEDPDTPEGPDTPTDPDPDTPPTPDSSVVTIEGDGFNIKQAQHVPDGGSTIVVNMTASEGIKGLTVRIDSETLTPEILEGVGLKANLDLVNPGSLEEGLKGLGFPVKGEVTGKTQLKFDISQFTSLLGIYGAATHKFIITVTDQKGKSVTETLTLISE